MDIKFYDYEKLYDFNVFQLIFEIKKNLLNGEFILGSDLDLFEKNLAKFLNVNYAIGLSDCTNALTVGIKCLNFKERSEIIIPSHTFIATLNSIYNSGHIPIVADIDDSGLLDLNQIEKYISKNTAAILLVNINGNTVNIEKLKKISEKYNIEIIEDNAQGFGSKYKNIFCGTFGKFGALSFYPTKILGCFGDGGAILTDDKELYQKIRKYRNHGRDESGKILSMGGNYRLDNFQAKILNMRLLKLADKIKFRRTMANAYNNYLSNNKNIFLPKINKDVFCSYQNYEILCNRRDDLQDFLKKKKIQTLVQWKGIPLHQQTFFNFKCKMKNCDEYFKKCLCLPLNYSISKDKIKYVSDAIIQFYGE